MSNPPDELRRAAALLEAARTSTSPAELERMLDDARDICANVIAQIDALRDPSERAGAEIRRRSRTQLSSE